VLRAGLVSKAGAGPPVNGSQLWLGVVDNVHEALSHNQFFLPPAISLFLDGRHVVVGKVVEGRTIMKLSNSQKQNVTITSALISEALKLMCWS
jgi:cyclophilin family peptidyl-prolyl cis-trans isomerase